jgi:phospholipase A1
MRSARHLACAATLAAGLALDHAVAATVSECHALADPAARLACYDAATGLKAGTAGAAATQVAEPAAGSTAAAPASAPGKAVATGATAKATEVAPTRPSMLGERWALDPAVGDRDFDLRYHNPSYIIGRWSNGPNDSPMSPTLGGLPGPVPLDHVEAKFQFSFKARLWEAESRQYAVWAAYTQQSNWQIANGDLSRPFRETDYQPELIFTYRPDLEFGGVRWRLLNLGLVHQSNGRAEPLSRSWNRIYAQFGLERDNFALLVRPWYRFKESSDKDDNPDITDYYGYGDIVALYRTDRGHTFTLTGRGNVRTGKGSVEFEWSTPPILGPFKGYFQVFSGYGESLIDYNWNQTTVGVGLSLNDLL